MATLPSNSRYEWRGLQLARKSTVERVEMDRGVPKQRRISTGAMVQIELVLHFNSKAEALFFEDTWFDVTINGGQDYFDFTHPISGLTVQARVVGGELGPLIPMSRNFGYSKRAMRIEWLKVSA